MLTSVGRDRICVLRAVTDARDTLAHRRTLERAIEPASLRPRGFAPRAIVCVRHLRMIAVGHAWTTRLESQVEQVVSRAARPFAEMVPASAQAVLFRDESEMLACLARDWRARDAWWWRGLLGRDADEDLVHQRLLDAPTLLPSIVSLLADGGVAHETLQSLPSSLCTALSEAATRTFALPREVSAPEIQSWAPEDVQPEDRTLETRRSVRALQSLLQSVGNIDALGAMAEAQRHLLVLCLMIARAPVLARTRPCAPLLARWIASNRSAQRRSTARSALVADTYDRDAHESSQTAVPAGERERSRAADPGADTMRTTPASRASHISRRDDLAPGVDDGSAAHADQRELISVSSPTMPSALASTSTADAIVAALSSDYAGVFYLVNALLHMELYADFAHPERPSVPVALGDLLAMIAERYCGALVRHDPIWGVLAAIAGRDSRQAPRRTLHAGAVRRRDVRAFDRWFVGVLARMEERLSRALVMPPEDTLAFLCARPGTLALTDTRLDVRFPLADHPLAIRLAGLDRDAGWVPAAGRIIEFHFD